MENTITNKQAETTAENTGSANDLTAGMSLDELYHEYSEQDMLDRMTMRNDHLYDMYREGLI